MGKPLIANFQERLQLTSSDHLCPVDGAIEGILRAYLAETEPLARGAAGSGQAFILERHGMARVLSLPAEGDLFESAIVSSYRVFQGVCHNPKNDRRTTQGVFHVTEGGYPIPADKKAVPKITFAHLLKAALRPPARADGAPLQPPGRPQPAEVFVSLLLRPLVCPEVPGFTPAKTMETRFFAPGNLVSNLDFVESIFGNAGDPHLPVNNARLDVDRLVRTHRMRHPGPASGHLAQEGRGAAAHTRRPPNARNGMGCAGIPLMSYITTAAPSRSPAAITRE